MGVARVPAVIEDHFLVEVAQVVEGSQEVIGKSLSLRGAQRRTHISPRDDASCHATQGIASSLRSSQ